MTDPARPRPRDRPLPPGSGFYEGLRLNPTDELLGAIVRNCKHDHLLGQFGRGHECESCGTPLAEALRPLLAEPGLGDARALAINGLLANAGLPSLALVEQLERVVLQAQRDHLAEMEWREMMKWLTSGSQADRRKTLAVAKKLRKLEPAVRKEIQSMCVVLPDREGPRPRDMSDYEWGPNPLTGDEWTTWVDRFTLAADSIEDALSRRRGKRGAKEQQVVRGLRVAVMNVLAALERPVGAHRVLKLCEEAVFGKAVKDAKTAARRARRRLRKGGGKN